MATYKRKWSYLEPTYCKNFPTVFANLKEKNLCNWCNYHELGGFSIGWADKLRKAVAKKEPAAFEALTRRVF